MADDSTGLGFADSVAESGVEIARDEQQEAEWPAWLPQNFRRDSIEDSARALSDSYKHAQRKITEQGEELRQLREQLTAVTLPEPSEEYGWSNESEPTFEQPVFEQPQPRSIEQLVQQALHNPAAAAAVAAQMQSPQLQALAQQAVANTLDVERQSSVVAEGWRLAAEANPQIADKASEIAQVLDSNHDAWLVPAIQAGSPTAVAGAIGEAFKTIASQEALPELMRTMKLQAQTATGAMGRPDPEATNDRWGEIVNAGRSRLQL